MNECAAIKLLRLLIQNSTHNVLPTLSIPISFADWCCGQHAIVASLVFAGLGQKTRIAKGRVIVITEGAITPALNHYFVMRNHDNGVFDSSITFPIPPLETNVKFCGIGFSGCPDFPDLRIMHTRKNPSKIDLDNYLKGAKTQPAVLYVEDEEYQPQDMIEMKSAGESGKWIEQTFGSQFGIWPRFAHVIVDELLTKPTGSICFDKAKLVEKVKATPSDTIHKFRTICRKLK